MVLPQQLEIPTTEQGCDWVSAVPQPSAEVSVTVLRTVAELESLREVWTRWNRHPLCDLDFYLTILAVRPEVIRPHVIVAGQGGRPQTILIGRLEQKALEFRLGYYSLARPICRVLTFLYDGLIGNHCSGLVDPLVGSVTNSLDSNEADVALFEPLPVGTALHEKLANGPEFARRRFVFAPAIHRSLSVRTGSRSCLSHLSSKTRKNLRWQAKKFTSLHSARIENHSQNTDIDSIGREVEGIAGNTYQRKLGVGFVYDREMKRRLELQAATARLRCYILYADQTPCAFWLGSVYKNIFYSEFMGYQPEHATHSPGMFLVTSVIDSLSGGHADELERVDFGLGDAQYKQVLGTDSWSESLVYIFAPTFKGYWLSAVHNFVGHLDHFARLVLRRAGSLDKVKRAMRG